MGWLPDKVKSMLGLEGAAAAPAAEASTGAGVVMAKAGPAALSGGAAAKDQVVKTELYIRADNLPPSLSVETKKTQAGKTTLNLGYAMAEA